MIKTTFIFCLSVGAKQKASDHLRNVSAPGHHPHQTYNERLPEDQGEGFSSRHPWALAQSWGAVAGFQGHPVILHSQTAFSSPTSMVRGRFRKRGQSTASAHTLPTETISELRPWLPSSSVQFLRYFNRGGKFPGGPPTEMPHVRERLFSFPFAVNEFYSWQRLGAGSDPHRS